MKVARSVAASMTEGSGARVLLKARCRVFTLPSVLLVTTAARFAGSLMRAETAADLLASRRDASDEMLPRERMLAAVRGVEATALLAAVVFCQPHSGLKSPKRGGERMGEGRERGEREGRTGLKKE